MFKYLLSDKYQYHWLIFHMLLGFVTTVSIWPLVFWVYLVFIGFFFSLFDKNDGRKAPIFLLAYTFGVEVLARGAKAAPFIPSELGKYMAVFISMLALSLGGPIKRTSIYGIFMLLLSFPALFVNPDLTRKGLVFNYFGPLALFLCVMYCSRQILTFTEFRKMARLMVYSIFALMCFAIRRASEFEKIDYGLTANFEAAGGSITNQVALLFGTAISILALMAFSGQSLFSKKLVDYALIGGFALRGLLTFSRGGMVTAALAILLVIIWPKAAAKFQDSQVKLRRVAISQVFFAILLLVGVFIAVNAYTNNYLVYRYQGRTERSLRTGFTNKIDADQLTSGRITIAESDIKMFFGNPFLGVGVGASMGRRPEYGGPPGHASHLEMTRLLSEHGFLGFILVILIFVYPFFKLLKEPNNYVRSISLVFLVIALSATFHQAMRTMITPVLFGFAFIRFVPDNYDWVGHLSRRRKVVLMREIGTQPKQPDQMEPVLS